FVTVIQEECDRMVHLLGDVTDLSRIEGGECTLRLTALTLEELVRPVFARLQGAADARGVTLDVAADATPIEVDAELMQRAIDNLAQNAIEFSPRGGRVQVSLIGGTDDWRCEVEDDGPPLPEEDLAEIFKRFQRARRRARPDAEGSAGPAAAADGPWATR